MVKNLIRLSVVFALFASVVPCQAAGSKLLYIHKNGAVASNRSVKGIKTDEDVKRVEALVAGLDLLLSAEGPQSRGFDMGRFVSEFRSAVLVEGNEGATGSGSKRQEPFFARHHVPIAGGKRGATLEAGLTDAARDRAVRLYDDLKKLLAARKAEVTAASAQAAISVVVPPSPSYVSSPQRHSPPTQSTITPGVPSGARPVMTPEAYQALQAALAAAAANQPASPTTIANDPTAVAAAMFAPAPSAPSATVTGQTNTPQANSSFNSGQTSGAGSQTQTGVTPPVSKMKNNKRNKVRKNQAKPKRPSYATVELPTTHGTGWLAAGATGTLASSAALTHFLKQGGYDKILRWFNKQERAKMSKEEKALVEATGLSSGSLLASLLMLARGGVLRQRYNRANTRISANKNRPFTIEADGSLSNVVTTDGDRAYLAETLADLKRLRRTSALADSSDRLSGMNYAHLRNSLGKPTILPSISKQDLSAASQGSVFATVHPEYAELPTAGYPAVDNLIKDLADAVVSQQQSRSTGWLATGGAGAAVSVPALIHFLKKGGYKKALKLLSKKERALMSDEDKALAWKTSGSAAAVAASLAALVRGGSLRRSHRKAVEAAIAA